MKLETPIVALGEVLWDLLPSGRRAGGAPFNFAFHCTQLGHPAIIVSRVGDDHLGRELREEVKRLGMSDEFIQTDREHPTGTVKVQLDANGQPTYTIAENVAWDFIEWSNRLEALARSGGVACFGTLAQRHMNSRETIRQYLRQARPTVLTVCDINLRPPFVSEEVVFDSISRADWLKLNDDEVNDVLRSLGKEWLESLREERVMDDSSALMAASDVALVCITHGAKGCTIRSQSETVEVPGIPVQVADTIGAGDGFTAALLTQTLEGKPLAEAARFANAYAAVVASKPGGTPFIRREEVERWL